MTHEAGSDYRPRSDRGRSRWQRILNSSRRGRRWSRNPYITFDYTDTAGNIAATVTRTVVVEDSSAPIITLIGDTNVTHEAGDYRPGSDLE